ncbi:hypothetical protein H5410_057279 [Solanum commersonii]|uniref:Uncharacterized protein n=1 Tax=Solanum commersonii TaxID=4109 RepID=A0A9J5WMK4_SOLCO|nr:hypothetical protein H5410_057279 [Solanum commersonii]
MGTTIPPAPVVPRGQTQRYGAKAITSEGKKWYKSHMEAKYFSDVILDDVNLEREFPHIMHHLQELHMGLIFSSSIRVQCCVVREFYMPLLMSSLGLISVLHISRSNMFCVGHNPLQNGFDMGTVIISSHILTLHMNREARVWLRIIMNCLIPGLYFIKVTKDRVCLVYSLMKDPPINVGAVLKSAMRKARSSRGERGLHVTFVHHAPRCDKDKGPENMYGLILTTAEGNRKDDMITARMFGLEILRHRNGCRA